MARILAVDDEKGILNLVKRVLEKDGHQVKTLSDPAALSMNGLEAFDLILLDVMMPGTDGFTLCWELRDNVDCPILFLTAKTMEKDIMYGLGIGGDDYITKPFGNGELRARVAAHLRREKREKRSVLSLDGIRFNLCAHEMMIGEQKVSLTKSEYAICEFLARSHGQVFSKEQIYEAVYGYEGEGDSSAIAEHVKNIRAKLSVYGCAPIETVWGIGYKWK